MQRRIKTRIAGLVAAVLLAGALAAGFLLASMYIAAHPGSEGGFEFFTSDNTEHEFVEVNWEYWLSINPDIVGWVTVANTAINYPIVQAPAENPTFYLTHDIYGRYNVYGAVYLDAECAEDGLFGSRNAVVFGHHMNDGSMFSEFAKYADCSYAQDHATVYVQTPDEQRVYTVCFSEVIDASVLVKQTDFASAEEYETWYENHRANATAIVNNLACPETLITWCTCSYTHFGNERTLVYSAPG